MKKNKFLALPLHHIDTSVILEKETTENGRYCKKYLNIVGTKYRGMISFPVLSELFLNVLRLETFNEKWDALHLITSLIKEKKIEIYHSKNIFEVEGKVAEIDKRLQSADRQIVSCAVEHNALLVTLDSSLINNEGLKSQLGIEINHPKDFIKS